MVRLRVMIRIRVGLRFRFRFRVRVNNRVWVRVIEWDPVNFMCPLISRTRAVIIWQFA